MCINFSGQKLLILCEFGVKEDSAEILLPRLVWEMFLFCINKSDVSGSLLICCLVAMIVLKFSKDTLLRNISNDHCVYKLVFWELHCFICFLVFLKLTNSCTLVYKLSSLLFSHFPDRNIVSFVKIVIINSVWKAEAHLQYEL